MDVTPKKDSDSDGFGDFDDANGDDKKVAKLGDQTQNRADLIGDAFSAMFTPRKNEPQFDALPSSVQAVDEVKTTSMTSDLLNDVFSAP